MKVTRSVISNAFNIKLPKITLPKFNGNITKFQAFWQTFQCSIDENESLSDIHKLNYLVNSLEGPAYKAHEGLELAGRNYSHAVETLKTRFGSNQQIVSAHMQAFLNLQNHPNDNVTQLRSIFNNINVHVWVLESLGITSEKFGSLLIPVIMSRMSPEIALQVARKSSEDLWEIREILKIIWREIEAREMSQRITAESRRDKHAKQRAASPTATTQSFVSNSRSRNKLECCYCQKEHFPSQCKQITDTKERKRILIQGKRCFNCLKSGHDAKSCNNTGRCRNCKQKHHTTICLNPDPSEKSDRNLEKSNAENSGENSITAAAKNKKKVLLQTATAYAFTEDRQEKLNINLLFDGGSQKSYIAEETKKKLGWKTQTIDQLNLNTFGND